VRIRARWTRAVAAPCGAAEAALTAEAKSVAAHAEAAAKDAESALKEAEEEPVAPAPVAESRSVPSYSITAYCRRIGDTAGGSSMIEKACRDMEADALAAIEAQSIPARVRSYCDQIGRTAGGSYQIYNSCVDMELEAAAAL
jgi:hypothetical protein